ncbi:hypothetical protein ACOSP7_010980 [Xanthoceras sorbifolium]|uniref:Cyclin-like domain-containing protein n=1 Tax=Xanthoceras sorbifolium TaxID=99658 RepID=A0ABQ8HS73_9ROSI|nr:hypothetical protein JRO89_XS07G0035300 [Xanthoceras sorbifolium]
MSEVLSEEPQLYARKWYFSKKEIEDFSPSRKDGISLERESELRKLYCSFLRELGIKLKVPQVAIGCAMMLCHQFYMRRSHVKNSWQTIATACLFLASKIEETRCMLDDVVLVSYEIVYKQDPSTSQRIRQKREVFKKQKDLIIAGEMHLLSTIAYDLDIQLPYKPLVPALKRLQVFPDLAKVAWNFVNDWLCTTLCLQYKPHYIAAGSLFLAAKFQKVKLPTQKGKFWWLEFDISPKQLEDVIKQMLHLLEQDRMQALPPRHERITKSALVGKTDLSSPQSSVSDGSSARLHSSHVATADNNRLSKSPDSGEKHISDKEALPCQTSESASSSVVEEGEGESQPSATESNQKPDIVSALNKSIKIDTDRIREALKRRRCAEAAKKQLAEANIDPEIDNEAWIERELENGIELDSAPAKKKQSKHCGEVLTC